MINVSQQPEQYYRKNGFTLIELIIVVTIVGILVSVALPSYRQYVVRASREAVQSEMLEYANLQEKIYLNSNAYSTSIIAAYNGTAGGGLGRNSGQSRDNKYNLTMISDGQTFMITATPVATSTQKGDGNITISHDGRKMWGEIPW